MDISQVTWRKASYSTSNGGGCVEVVSIPAAVAVRDSKAPDGPALAFAAPGWQAFTSRIKGGTLHLG